MKIEKLGYLVEVGKTKSISIAAKNLHVSQAGLSQSILNIEEELGVKIFKRSRGNRAVLTVEGKQLIDLAQEIVMKHNELKDKAQSFSNLINGELRISTIPGFLSILIHPLLEFKQVYPKINIEILEKPIQEIIVDVQENKVDFGLITYWKPDNIVEQLHFETLIEGKMKVFVSKNSPFALNQTIKPEQLFDQNFVLYNGDYVKWFVNDFFKTFKPIHILFTSNNVEAITKAVAEGLAITFAPDFSPTYNPYSRTNEIVPISIENHNRVNMSYGWIRSNDKHVTNIGKEFINYIQCELQNRF